METTRYRLRHVAEHQEVMTIDDDGDYVLYDDHCAEIDRLKADLAWHKAELEARIEDVLEAESDEHKMRGEMRDLALQRAILCALLAEWVKAFDEAPEAVDLDSGGPTCGVVIDGCDELAEKSREAVEKCVTAGEETEAPAPSGTYRKVAWT